LTKIDYSTTSNFRRPVAWEHISGFVVVLNACDPEYLRALRASGKPVVLVSQEHEGVRCPVVMPGNASGVRAAVEHLIGHGHDRIAFAGWIAQHDTEERYQAYRETLIAHGIEPDRRLLFDAGDNWETGGERAARQMIESGLRSTAVVVATDFNAIGLMRTLSSAGYRLPEDQAVVGFDNVGSAVTATPSLSSIDPRFYQLGETAVALLLRQLSGEPVPAARHHLPATFVARESCGCQPDRADPTGSCEQRSAVPPNVAAEIDYLQSTLETQYLLSMDLLHSHAEDPRALGWLRRTVASNGCLGLWSQHSPAGSADSPLSIAGVYRRDPAQSPVSARDCTASTFPPMEMLSQIEPTGEEICHVAPVTMGPNDWGLLAYVSPVDRQKSSVVETTSQWAALLRMALDYEHALASMRQQEEQMRRQALYDNLTGLPNRALFLDRLRLALLQAERYPGHQCSVLFFDLDGFKLINDSLGHPAGDQLLSKIGERITADLRGCDVVARFGGDEFAVLVDDVADTSLLEAIADRLKAVIAQPVDIVGHEVVVTASIGIARSTLTHRYQCAEDMLRDADIAMYRAKSSKKGSHTIFDTPMRQEVVARVRTAEQLRHATVRGELELPARSPLPGTRTTCGAAAR
jgi:diguanylate cyclase (GGDEF)-like protein